MVDQIRTKVFEKTGIGMPTTTAVVERAIVDLAAKYGIKVSGTAPSSNGRRRGAPKAVEGGEEPDVAEEAEL